MGKRSHRPYTTCYFYSWSIFRSTAAQQSEANHEGPRDLHFRAGYTWTFSKLVKEAA